MSEEPYVPWELAGSTIRSTKGPPFLGSQVVVGRWVRPATPVLPPPEVESGTLIAVVAGVYDKVPGRNRLFEAEEEAQALTERYGACPSTPRPRRAGLLGGVPRADVLHFAVHGVYDEGGVKEGLVLVDR